jgi:Multicopper oxidase
MNSYTQGTTEFDNIITKQGPLTGVPTNILFNGMNVNANGSGTRLTVEVQPGMRHLMRFINTGVDNYYEVGIGMVSTDMYGEYN